MDIRKTIAAVITATMVLSMTACGNNNTFIANNGGAGTNSNDSSTDKIFGIEDDVPDPPKQVSMWDVLPEIPVTDASAFTYKYDSELGGMVVTDYLRESPKVRIPDKLEGEPVVEVRLSLCQKEITQLVMPDSVKKFYKSSSISKTLQYVNVPKALQYVDYPPANGAIILDNFSELKGLYVPYGITRISCTGCKNLTSINLPNSVTAIGEEDFSGCTNLTSATIGNGVTVIGEKAFSNCINLTSVTIPDSVTEIGERAFSGCTSLTSVTIPDSVTKIGSVAFYETPWLNDKRNENRLVVINNIIIDGETCSGDVAIPDGVTEIGGGVFWDSTNLTSITIPNSVTQIDDSAFRKCTSLTNVTIPDSVTTIGDLAFYGCENIQATYKGKTYDYEHIEDLYAAINGY